jgi:2-polyprenyl-6-methoxyphenol hydroxylase-like FAD-dependent oxidoreductase
MRPLAIAIVGAGPGGMACALLLRRLGHRVVIFEQFDTPQPVGSGLIVQPTGMAVLEQLNLADAVRARAAPIRYIDGRDAKTLRSVLEVRYGALGNGLQGYGIHRGALFEILLDEVRCATVALETASQVAGFLPSAAGNHRVLFESGRQSAGFDLVIDASGARSRLLGHAGQSFRWRKLAYGAVWASLGWRHGPCAPDALTQRYRDASVMIGVLPIGRMKPGGKDLAAFFWSLKPDEYDALRAKGIGAWKARIEEIWPQVVPYLDQISDWDQLTLARYGHHTLPMPAGRGIAFIGDSAHSTSPQLGQGANMALLDAAALAAALAEYGELDQALAEYARSRRLHVRLFQALSWLLTPFYQSDSAMLAFVRDRLVATVAKIPPAPRILAMMVAGTLGWSDRHTAFHPDQVTNAAARRMEA